MKAVQKWYGDYHALKDLNFSVEQGERVVICGPSGSGKSTLIRCINGLETCDAGSIVVNGIELTQRSKSVAKIRSVVGMVFQQFNLFPHLSALENCTLALTEELGLTQSQADGKAMQYLSRVRIADQATKRPAQLSGGQQQRVAIARALVHEPRLVVCDEPTAALDASSGRRVMDLLRDVAVAEDRACIIVTHDNRIFDLADRILVLEDGRITHDGKDMPEGH